MAIYTNEELESRAVEAATRIGRQAVEVAADLESLAVQSAEKLLSSAAERARELIEEAVEVAKVLRARIKHLEGIVPIYSYCKSIRDDVDDWHRLEAYISEYTDAEFSHGICPSCYEKHIKNGE
ncbi:MAG: translation initiation factor 2B subunit (eIF-2B alpha/beta/delta family) [Desulforhopalus sp.]|jgi:translation initiation factor 2B subunit (eIF-2B alpha/beta/delta family)